MKNYLTIPATLMATLISAVFAIAPCSDCFAQGDSYDREPINYTKATPRNTVSQIQEQLAEGKLQLNYDETFGYLPDLLKVLKVSQKSQMFVFSKTSLQRMKISPTTPRAVYFNDDVYVGYCHTGDVLEVSAVDPQLGAVFYTLDQSPDAAPKLVRQTDSCLICHGSSHTKGVPGHVVRSVYSDKRGLPILSSGSFRVDQSTPIKNRWGGWYVTGKHGDQSHLGNLVIQGRRVPEPLDNSEGQNVTNLKSLFEVKHYLTPHSDLIALMVLEHQTMAHNLITSANFTARQALYYEKTLNKELGEKPDHRWASTTSRIKNAGDDLVEYLLFCEEVPLKEQMKGTSGFTEEFTKQGVRDSKGRSLRDFDLKTRMFKYPCSYLVYSNAFEAMHEEMKDYVWKRIWDILQAEELPQKFAHLSKEDRTAIVEILKETKKTLPKYWYGEEKTK